LAFNLNRKNVLALSRAYYNHRYSDDLDFFVNKCSNFDEQVYFIFEQLKTAGFWGDTNENYTAMPKTEFDKISWVKTPAWETFRIDIDKIVFNMMGCV
jgi:hypothetical protein